jgi:hypothetical protein
MVRAYDFVSARFDGRAGDQLMVTLAGDPGRHLHLLLRPPSGAAIRLQRDDDGLIERIRLPEQGEYRLEVSMDGEQARVGRTIRFALGLSRRPP